MGDLVKQTNPVVLNVVVVVLLIAVIGVAVYLILTLRDARKTGRSFKFWKFSLGASPAAANSALAIHKPAEQPVRPYRKVLYIKVTYLSDQAKAQAPFYTRTITRLQPDANFAVYDEGVYYTLELFSTRKEISSRSDSSTGIVDPRTVIPWIDHFIPRESTAKALKESVQTRIGEDTDTLLTVSHFVNGLQGEKNYNFASDVPEDAEYVRLIVDFSSIPGARLFVSSDKGEIVSADGVPSSAAVAKCGESIYMLSREPGRKGEMLSMYFNFDWSRLPPKS